MYEGGSSENRGEGSSEKGERYWKMGLEIAGKKVRSRVTQSLTRW